MTNNEHSGATCRSCAAPIIWAVTSNGRAMPLDAEPNVAGTIVLRGHFLYFLTEAEQQEPVTEPRYKSHFATCPNAQQHRKKGK